MKMKNIYLLGASGSIGQQTIEVLRFYRDQFCLKSIAVGKNIDYARQIINEFDVEYVSVKEESDAKILASEFPNIKFGYGQEGLIEAATFSNEDGLLVNAVVGMVGLEPTIKAIQKKRDILLANKETLVVGGEIITRLVKEHNVKLIPIDSEHSAIFQALNHENIHDVKRLIITASGGSFRDYSRSQLASVSLEDALKHPNWSMGAKITIDSATMVNKGLEVIEAHYLFDIDYEKIETIIHPESIIHSMVEFVDNSIIAQLSNPDMRIPIQYALSYPKRFSYNLSKSLDFNQLKYLSFKDMDYERFPLLKLAYEVGHAGGVMPVIYNASNEVANELFRQGKINFLDIEKIIFEAVKNNKNIINPTLEEILAVDKKIRNDIYKKYEVNIWT